MYTLKIGEQNHVVFSSKKVDGFMVMSKAPTAIMNDLLDGSTKKLIEVVNLLFDYVDKFKDRAVMENLLYATDESGKEFFLIEDGTEFKVVEGTLMERKVSAVGLFLTRLGMEIGSRLSVSTYRDVEKRICKALSPLILKNIKGKGVPPKAELIGYGMMKFVFKHGDKVYKYYHNKSLIDSGELKIEPYILHLLHNENQNLFAKVHSFNGDVIVQDYIDGYRLDEVLSLTNLTENLLKSLAVDTVEILKSLLDAGVSSTDLSALNIVLDKSSMDLCVIDLDAVPKDNRLTKKMITDSFVTSIEHLKWGKDFSNLLLMLLDRRGLWEKLPDRNTNEHELMNRTDFIEEHNLQGLFS